MNAKETTVSPRQHPEKTAQSKGNHQQNTANYGSAHTDLFRFCSAAPPCLSCLARALALLVALHAAQVRVDRANVTLHFRCIDKNTYTKHIYNEPKELSHARRSLWTSKRNGGNEEE